MGSRKSVTVTVDAEQGWRGSGANTGAVAAPAERGTSRALLRHPLTARRAGLAVSAATVLATVVSGVVLWLVDRSEFPNIGLGLWWAVQTVTTVGYGDAVPTTVPGRVIAAVVMVLGIGFLSVFTAAITAAFVESARRRLRGDELADVAARLDAIGDRLDRIEAKLGERS